jgi:selenocysteine lyase/cysteine desulfurase
VDDVEWLGERLRRDHSIEISVHRSRDRTLVRLSVQAYTSEEECALLVEALESAARVHNDP